MRTRILFLDGSLLVLLLVFPGPAHARWRRIPAIACMPPEIPFTFSGETTLYNYNGGVLPFPGESENSSASLVCPFDDSSLFRRQDVNVLNVHGNTFGSKEISVSVCSRSWNNLAVNRCTSKRLSPGAGQEFVVSFSRGDLNSVWGPPYAADFGYITVGTPPRALGGTGSGFVLYGIFAGD